MTRILWVLLVFIANTAQSQFVFFELPKDYQLFPRNEVNLSTVYINGTCNHQDADTIFLIVEKSSQHIDTIYQAFSKNDNVHLFSFKYTIEAGLFNYLFQIGAIKHGQFSIVKSIGHICSGDVYLINGQSNALAQLQLEDTTLNPLNEYVRSFGSIDHTSGTLWQTDTTWGYGLGYDIYENTHHFIGILGYTMADSLVRLTGIPICIINGAKGATRIEYHQKSENTNSIYAKLLYRCDRACVSKYVKAMIWFQGESNSGQQEGNYTKQFANLYKNWKLDFPSIEHLYVYQIHHGCGNVQLATVREEQRRLISIDPLRIHLLSTMNIVHDGCHFYKEGYQQLAFEATTLIAHDVYGRPIELADYAPDILKAYYKTPKQLAIVFSQPIFYDKVYKGYDLRNYFLNEYNRDKLVESISSNADTLLLTLYFNVAFETISYTPENVYSHTNIAYQGPYIYNSKGWGAFAFNHVAVEGYVYEDDDPETIIIYPNPIRKGYPYWIHSKYDYTIYDMNGKPIEEYTLIPGLYVLRNRLGETKRISVVD